MFDIRFVYLGIDMDKCEFNSFDEKTEESKLSYSDSLVLNFQLNIYNDLKDSQNFVYKNGTSHFILEDGTKSYPTAIQCIE